MAETGFIIDALSVEGPGKPNASIRFAVGLNVVAGASNTGKTFVFQAIDFMLGASKAPKHVPEATGYSEVYLQLTSKTGSTVAFRRSLQGGDVALYGSRLEDIGVNGVAPTTLAAKHEKGNVETISGHLLSLSGLFDREVRTNKEGEKRSLSFRDIAWLSLIDEERIIAERSPALSGQYTEAPVEKSILGLLLTGVDDAAIVAQEKPKDRKARIRAELALLDKLLTDREERLTAMKCDVPALEADRSKIRAAIDEASQIISATQEEVNSAATIRDQSWSRLQEANSQRRFLAEQAKRLRLLREYYNSDRQRLESSLEAGVAFNQLPAGECPICGAPPAMAEVETEARLREFQTACNAEMAKISSLLRDLAASENELREEDSQLATMAAESEASVNEANEIIRQLLARKRQVSDTSLSQLMARESQFTEAILLTAEIADLRSRHEMATELLNKRQKRIKLEKKVETSTAAGFCRVMEATLKAWKFPFEGGVSFDSERFDVVIGDQNRSSFGKGYRAVTHAAFAVALLRYCRQEGFPHPGVVILDTPLNPFKGPDQESSDRVNQEVQNAFYADLAADRSGDQFIVFENTEPSIDLKQKISYQHFSGNLNSGRPGFFPLQTK